jgi:hypothetical protein
MTYDIHIMKSARDHASQLELMWKIQHWTEGTRHGHRSQFVLRRGL